MCTETTLRELTEFSARHNGTVAFDPTVIRFGPGRCEVSLMNRQAGGWGEFSFTYQSLWTVARIWRLRFVAMGEDEHGTFVRVEPMAAAATHVHDDDTEE